MREKPIVTTKMRGKKFKNTRPEYLQERAAETGTLMGDY